MANNVTVLKKNSNTLSLRGQIESLPKKDGTGTWNRFTCYVDIPLKDGTTDSVQLSFDNQYMGKKLRKMQIALGYDPDEFGGKNNEANIAVPA
ncbi:MAG: hypothetical protein FWD49_01880 [Firmicutes bacterium]|nr:hypothetical protein [Bacillota bacterium]